MSSPSDVNPGQIAAAGAKFASDIGALKDATDNTKNVMKLIGGVIGSVVSIVGDIEAIGAIVGILAGNNGPSLSDIQKQIQDLGAQIQEDFHKLDQDNGAQQILDRNTAIWKNNLSTAYTDVQDLMNAMLMNSPLSKDQGQMIRECQDACNSFYDILQSDPFVDQFWSVNYDYRVFWDDTGVFWTYVYDGTVPVFGPPLPIWTQTDVGYGQQNPPLNDDRTTIFYYPGTLPAYLFAIACFISVATLDPNFPMTTDYRDFITLHANHLAVIHDKIAYDGIIYLRPPAWQVGSLYADSIKGTTGIRMVLDPWGSLKAGVGYPPLNPDGSYAELGGVIEYGAVDRFTGASEIETSYGGDWTDQPPVIADDPSGPSHKLQLRALAKCKQLYQDIGLPTLWNTINELRKLAGERPLPRPTYGDWSLADDIIPNTPVKPDPSIHGVRLRTIAGFIAHTWPIDTAPSLLGTSFREILTGTPSSERPNYY